LLFLALQLGIALSKFDARNSFDPELRLKYRDKMGLLFLSRSFGIALSKFDARNSFDPELRLKYRDKMGLLFLSRSFGITSQTFAPELASIQLSGSNIETKLACLSSAYFLELFRI